MLTLAAVVESLIGKRGLDTERKLSLTPFGALRVASFEQDGDEIARHGRRFAGGCQVIASGIAPVAAIPTTTATLCLYNPSSEVSLWPRRITKALGSGIPAAGSALLLCVTNGPIVAASVPVADADYNSTPLGRKDGHAAVARWGRGAGVTIPAGSAWWIARADAQLAAANVGQGDDGVSLSGICVPPGYGLGIAILSGAGTTPLYSVSVVHDELAVVLE